MTLDEITITYPATKEVAGKRIPVTTVVQWTAEIKKFSEIPDGGMFLIGSKVYEKMGMQGTCAQLQPWDYDMYYEFKPDKIVGILKAVKSEKF